jgi:hypothetical protein
VGFVLKRWQPNYDFGKPKMALLQPNLNCILTNEMTLRDWRGEGEGTLYCGFAITGVQKLFSENHAFREIM